MKKLSKILVIVLCLCLIAGCGKNKNGNNEDQNQVVDNGGNNENQNNNNNNNQNGDHVKVQAITVTNENYIAGDVDGKGVNGYFNLVSSYANGYSITINCNVTPEDATNKNLVYRLDGKGYEEKNKPSNIFGCTYSYEINEDGSITVKFINQTDVIVTIASEDGNASIKVLLKVVNKKPGIK